MDARLYSGFQSSHRAPGFGEPPGKLDLELCGLMRCRCDSGKDVTRQQAHSEPVRIVKNDRVVDDQVKRRGGRHGRSQRALNLRLLHPADFLTGVGSAGREDFPVMGRRVARRRCRRAGRRSAPSPRVAGPGLRRGGRRILSSGWPVLAVSWAGMRSAATSRRRGHRPGDWRPPRRADSAHSRGARIEATSALGSVFPGSRRHCLAHWLFRRGCPGTTPGPTRHDSPRTPSCNSPCRPPADSR